MDMILVVVGSKMHINYEYGMDRNLLTNFTGGGHGRYLLPSIIRVNNNLYFRLVTCTYAT